MRERIRDRLEYARTSANSSAPFKFVTVPPTLSVSPDMGVANLYKSR